MYVQTGYFSQFWPFSKAKSQNKWYNVSLGQAAASLGEKTTTTLVSALLDSNPRSAFRFILERRPASMSKKS